MASDSHRLRKINSISKINAYLICFGIKNAEWWLDEKPSKIINQIILVFFSHRSARIKRIDLMPSCQPSEDK